MVHLAVCSYHIKYAFWIESVTYAFYSEWTRMGPCRTYIEMHRTDDYSQHNSIMWPVWLNGWVFIYKLSGCGFVLRCSHATLNITSVSRKKLLEIHTTIECGFTLKDADGIIRTYNQMHCIQLSTHNTTQSSGKLR